QPRPGPYAIRLAVARPRAARRRRRTSVSGSRSAHGCALPLERITQLRHARSFTNPGPPAARAPSRAKRTRLRLLCLGVCLVGNELGGAARLPLSSGSRLGALVQG